MHADDVGKAKTIKRQTGWLKMPDMKCRTWKYRKLICKTWQISY